VTYLLVNGKKMRVELTQLTYEQVLSLAGMTGTPSVVYRWRATLGDVSRQGTMWPGCEPVHLGDGMIFNVAHTGGA
jgi:hypothetical protein